MKWTSFWTAASLFAASPLWAASWETTSIRTAQGDLVTVGMPAAAARKALDHGLKHPKGRKSSGQNESWSYRGSDGLYHITVRGGQVRKIVVTPDRD
jgi:hypothetical protein